jgi:DNA-binding NarL/FixJ family response regulator
LTKDSGYLTPGLIKQIAAGKTYVQPDLVLELFQYSQPMNSLSRREYQVLTLIAQQYL